MEVARSAGATIVGQTFHQFSPQGVTGVVAIAESHVWIHTWPEYEYAAVDIFTCGDSFDPQAAARLIAEKLDASSSSITELARGVLGDPEESPGLESVGAYVTR